MNSFISVKKSSTMEEIASSSQRRSRRRDNEERVIDPSPVPNDLLEEIFLRLPVKAIMRFKSLSKQWRRTIGSGSFSQRHLKISERSHMDHPKLMVIGIKSNQWNWHHPRVEIGFQSTCSESGSRLSFNRFYFSQRFDSGNYYVSESCDGLFCIYSIRSTHVVNPATRWLRQLPLVRFQNLMHEFNETDGDIGPAFVKAADYKLVWLYNSDEYNSDDSSPNEGVTKCEVLDFRANAWRYLACTPSYRIYHGQRPASANGSLHWFTEAYDNEIKVVAFDIHTEKFRLLSQPNPTIANSDPIFIDMCTLDNRLCMSTRERCTNKEIWRLNSSEDMWEKICTIDLLSCSSSDRSRILCGFSLTPLAMICKNKKILFSHWNATYLLPYDLQTKSFRLFLERSPMKYAPYFPSLISHI